LNPTKHDPAPGRITHRQSIADVLQGFKTQPSRAGGYSPDPALPMLESGGRTGQRHALITGGGAVHASGSARLDSAPIHSMKEPAALERARHRSPRFGVSVRAPSLRRPPIGNLSPDAVFRVVASELQGRGAVQRGVRAGDRVVIALPTPATPSGMPSDSRGQRFEPTALTWPLAAAPAETSAKE
jgi:hypothetical protein